MNYKGIAHSIVARLPTNIENVSMSYLNRMIGEKTKSRTEFQEIKHIIVNEHIKKKSTNNNKTYKSYSKN